MTLSRTGANIIGRDNGNGAADLFSGDADAGDTTIAAVFAQTATVTADGETFTAGVLADNGGPVATIALKADGANPALDAAAGTGPTESDARGVAAADVPGVDNNGTGTSLRDLGAYEAEPEAPTLIVTTLDDVVDPFDNKTSLREAIAFANATLDVDGNPATIDTITFAAGLSGAIHLQTSELAITQDLVIDGDGRITVDANADGNDTLEASAPATGERRAFHVSGEGTNATFDGLTITGGRLSNAGVVSAGGGVHGARGATLTFENTTVSGNSTGNYGGGIYGDNVVTLTNATVSGNSAGFNGGGISASISTLINTTVSGNSAGFGGGIHGGTVTLQNATVSGNNATHSGGGIGNGAVKLTDSIVLGNSAPSSDEISSFATPSRTGANIIGRDNGNGAADVFSGDTDVGDTTIGDVFAETETVTANGQSFTAGVLAENGAPVATIALKADAANPALDAAAGPSPTESDARGVAAADVPGIGAGLRDLGAYEVTGPFETRSLVVTTLDDVVDPFDGETSLREALAWANATPDVDGDPATIDTVTFDAGLTGVIHLQNTELSITQDLVIDGDGRITIDANADGNETLETTAPTTGDRRAFFVTGADTDATFEGLTITGGRPEFGFGGGVFGDVASLSFTDSTVSGNSADIVGGGIYGNGPVTLTNATVSGNTAGSFGGGIYGNGPVTLTNATVSGNTALSDGGGIFGTTVTLTNATVSGNTARFDGGGILGSNVTLTDSIVLGNSALEYDEIRSSVTLSRVGTNIIGRDNGNGAADVFSGDTDVGDTTIADVFAQTATANGQSFTAGVLAQNGGPVATIALKADATNPALDAAAGPSAPAADARGVAAVDVPGVDNNGTGTSLRDLGAYEAEPEAPSLVVTTLDDVVDPFDNETSLREAIDFANATPDVDGSLVTIDTITFAAGLSGAIHLRTSELAITQDLVIDGDGRITVDANADGNDTVETSAPTTGDRRAFNVSGTGTDATFDGLTITGGRRQDFGGGVFGDSGTRLEVANSTITANSATYGGGVAGDVVTLENSTVSANRASVDVGGVFSASQGLIVSSTVSGNAAQRYTGAIGGFGNGSTTFTVTDSIVLGNIASLYDDRPPDRLSLAGTNIIGSSSGGGAADIIFSDGSSRPTTSEAVFAATEQLVGGLGKTTKAGVLADNGGGVQTIALKADAANPALDAASGTSPTLQDARGVAAFDQASIDNNGVAASVRDLGAFELDVQANRPPVSTDDTVTTPEDTPVVLGLDDFGSYNDAEGAPLAAVTFTASVPGLELRTGAGWAPVVAGQAIAASDIAAGHLRFVPAVDANGNGIASIGFKVGDGTATSTSTYTLSVDVTPVNDPAVITATVLGTVTEDAPTTQVTGVVTVTDPDIGEAGLAPIAPVTLLGVYGDFSINLAGGATSTWTYTLDNARPATQALAGGETKTETLTVTSLDGTVSVAVVVTVTGTEEPSLVVTTLDDVVDPFDNQTSLREAIAFANRNDNPGAIDTISFAPDLTGTIHLTELGHLEIRQDLVIEGEGRITIDANADGDEDAATASGGSRNQRAFGVFNDGTDAVFDGLFITGGYLADGRSGGGVGGDVGTTLTFDNAVLAGNYSDAFGGGVFGETVTIKNSVVIGNASNGGGGVYGTRITIENALVGENVSFSCGGGIWGTETIKIINSTVNNNSNNLAGGGIYAIGASVTLENSTVSGNSANTLGGGVYGETVSLVNATVSGNSAYLDGGGIYGNGAVTLTDSIVLGNSAGSSENEIFAGGLTRTGVNIIGQNDGSGAADVFVGDTDIRDTTITDVFAETTSVTAHGRTFTVGVLADNGGDQLTIALKAAATNPALDASAGASPSASDSRGVAAADVPGIGSGLRDLGAYEVPVAASVLLADLNEDTSRDITTADLAGSGATVTNLVASSGDLQDLGGGTWRFMPAENDDTGVAFSYTVDGGAFGSAIGSATLDLLPVNDAATITGTATGTVTEDATAVANGKLTVTDPDAGEASFVPATAAQLQRLYGAFTFDAATGAWRYTLDNTRPATQALAAGETKAETLTVGSLDGSATANIVVTVTGANDALTAVDDTIAAVEGETPQGNVLDNDMDSDSADRLAIVGLLNSRSGGLDEVDVEFIQLVGSYGVLTVARDGSYTYAAQNTPLPAGQTATETFTYRVSDGNGGTDTADIVVTVTGGNPPFGNNPGQVQGSISSTGKIEGVGDFDANGRLDFLWRDSMTNVVEMRSSNPTGGYSAKTLGTVGANLTFETVGDLDGDGSDDVVIRDAATGVTGAWMMRNGTPADWRALGTVGPEWDIAGAGDVDRNGTDDILLFNTLTRAVEVWQQGATGPGARATVGTVAAGWEVAGIGDLDGSGTDEVLFFNAGTRQLGAWQMSEGKPGGWFNYGTLKDGWEVTALGNFNGTGPEDIGFYNATTGQDGAWSMFAGTISDWIAKGTHDDLDPIGTGRLGGTTDQVLWHNPVTGALVTF
jgi:VCBS repeat-containing protein/predicted outer membrane repeat protein